MAMAMCRPLDQRSLRFHFAVDSWRVGLATFSTGLTSPFAGVVWEQPTSASPSSCLGSFQRRQREVRVRLKTLGRLLAEGVQLFAGCLGTSASLGAAAWDLLLSEARQPSVCSPQ